MAKTTVAVFFGGMSSEHDISCISAQTVAGGLDCEKYDVVLVGITKEGHWLLVKDRESMKDGSWRESRESAVLLPDASEKCLLITTEKGLIRRQKIDVAFPVLHGRFGEDGTIQGLFELARIPYVGCGVAASAVCMDKLYAKVLVKELGIAQARYVAFTKAQLQQGEAAAAAKVEETLDYPVFVKPTDGGSSQGVSRVERREELMKALELAASEGTRVMVEEAITGREIECAVLSTPEGTVASGVGEIKAAAEFYDFEAKYSNPDSETDTHPVFPAGKEDEVRADAVKIFEAVGGYGLARVERREDERLRYARAADRLHHDLHGRVGDHALRVRGQYVLVHGHAAVRRDVEVRDLLQDDVDAEALRHDVTMLQKAVSDSRADGSEAKNSYSYLLHLCIWPFFFVCPYIPRKSKRHVVYCTGIFRKIRLGGSGNGLGRRAVRVEDLDLEAGEVGEVLDLPLGIRPLAAVDGKANLGALALAHGVEHGGGVLLERKCNMVGPLRLGPNIICHNDIALSESARKSLELKHLLDNACILVNSRHFRLVLFWVSKYYTIFWRSIRLEMEFIAF